MMRTAVQTNISAEEYLQMEKVSERKHEFVYGNLFEMPGTTLRHNDIIANLYSELKPWLLKSGFKFHFCDIKVEAVKDEIYYYPDAVIAKAALQNNASYFVQQPILIAEVLSPATRTYDSTDKFIQYRKIASLQYYLLIEPEKQVVIFYKKSSSSEWQSDTFTGLHETIDFPILSASLSLAAIYES